MKKRLKYILLLLAGALALMGLSALAGVIGTGVISGLPPERSKQGKS